MKRFILGFQRLVWCPKWTPASSSWRMVTTATVVLPAVPVRPPPVVLPTVVDRVGGPGPRPARVPPGAGTVESRRRACVVARTPGPAPDDSTSPPTPALADLHTRQAPRPIRGLAGHQVPAAAPAAASAGRPGTPADRRTPRPPARSGAGSPLLPTRPGPAAAPFPTRPWPVAAPRAGAGDPGRPGRPGRSVLPVRRPPGRAGGRGSPAPPARHGG